MPVSALRNAIRWNIVAKNLSPGYTVEEKLRRKIGGLTKHLVHFPPETLHLQVVLEKLAKKKTFTVRLTLRLPSNILHVEKSDHDLLDAIDSTTAALEREVKSLKAELRGDYRWKRPAWRARLRDEEALVFSEPMPADEGPQTHADMIAALLDAHDAHLLAHARRELEMAELTGELPRGYVEARDLLDEAVRRSLDQPGSKPNALTYEQWFYRLIREGLQRQRQRYSEERSARGEPPLPSRDEAPQDVHEGYDAEQPLDVVTRQLAPEGDLPEGVIPDLSRTPPDAEVVGRDLVEKLQQNVKGWPSQERDVFELYYLVGFDVGDIAMILGATKEQVEALLGKIQLRLRDFLREAAL